MASLPWGLLRAPTSSHLLPEEEGRWQLRRGRLQERVGLAEQGSASSRPSPLRCPGPAHPSPPQPSSHCLNSPTGFHQYPARASQTRGGRRRPLKRLTWEQKKLFEPFLAAREPLGRAVRTGPIRDTLLRWRHWLSPVVPCGWWEMILWLPGVFNLF